MNQVLMKKTAFLCFLFFCASMGVMIWMSANKVITITDVAQDEVQENLAVKENSSGNAAVKNLTFKLGEADTSYLRIPLPEGCKADDIIIENHYMDRDLWILVPNADENFYEENVISGNRESVSQGFFEATKEGIALNFQLTGIYECRTILENENLYISFLAPAEMYDRIVVIDPACGGSNFGSAADNILEKDVNLQIARKLKEKLDGSDIKAYYTRMDDVNPSEEDRAALGNETRADMYIRIQVDASEDSSIYGTSTLYNGDYFIPGFGNVELADCLEREVVTAIKGKALGLIEAGPEEYTLRQSVIPAAAVRVGYITNKQEAALLGREEYTDKIAAGIYNAILKAYEKIQ